MSTTNEARQGAESTIKSMMDSNPQDFLMKCAQLLSNESQETIVRTGSASLIKNMTKSYPF